MKSFAIVVVCYNRTAGLRMLLDSLNKADYCGRNDITLIFSIDNSGSEDVLNVAKGFEWVYGEKIIRTFPERQGLKKHILQCGDYTESYDIVAVLEDDIVVSDSFYSYAYNAANYYWDNTDIAGISLYSFQKNWLKWVLRFEPMKTQYDTYFVKVAQSWGQVWIREKWKEFTKWYQENLEFKKDSSVPPYMNSWPDSSWLKYHTKYCITNNKYFVYPYYALSTNTSEAGEHANVSCNDFQVELQYGKRKYGFAPFDEKSVKYDEYFNREGIEKYLGVPYSENVTIDFYGTKRIDLSKEYILTAIKYDGIQPIKTFRLSLRPIESAIINGLEGNGIFLYNASDVNKKRDKKNTTALLRYEVRSDDWYSLFKLSLHLFIEKIKTKFLKKVMEGK